LSTKTRRFFSVMARLRKSGEGCHLAASDSLAH
jgi:hypothetical protein